MKEVTLSKIIGNTGVFIDGDWVESKDQDINGEVRLIQLADIGDGFFINKSNRFLTLEKAKELKCTFLKEGDLLIARMPDPLGRACIFPELYMPCVTVVDICIVRPDKNIAHANWLKFLINSYNFRNKINKYITGTTRQRISRGNLEKLTFSLPEIADQIKIAHVLNKAESLIKQRKESIDLLDEFLKSTFLRMFGDNEKTKKTQYSFNDIKSGGNETFSNGPFGSDLLTSELTDKGVPVIYIRDIRNGDFTWKSNVYVTHEKAKKLSNCLIKSRDVLIAKVGDPPGISAIYPLGMADGIITQDVVRIRLNEKIVLPEYFTFFLNSHFGKSLVKKISIEGTRNRFPLGDFKKLKVGIPDLKSQQIFALILEEADTLKKQYQSSLKELENLYASLSQRAFKGELDLSLLEVSIEEEEYASYTNDRTEEFHFPEPKFNVVKRETEIPIKEATAKPKKESSPKTKQNWESISKQQLANWINEKYSGFHFSSEMLIHF